MVINNMNQSLVDNVINYHGVELVDALHEEQVNVQLPSFLAVQNLVPKGRDQPRDDGFTKKVIGFISKKADLLFQNSADSEVTQSITRDDEEKNVFAVLPPLETFMDVPASDRKKQFFKSIQVGDLVVGTVSAIQESGITVTLLCMDNQKSRDIDDLRITAFCAVRDVPKMYAHESALDAFAMKDNVRGVILSVHPNKEKISISMMSHALPSGAEHYSVGLISEDELPIQYKHMMKYSGKPYGYYLEKSVGFSNPHNVSYLSGVMGILDSKPLSMMRGLRGVTYPEEDYSDKLRKTQSYRWALKSVAEGIQLFKEGKHIEAMQHLNKALQIDSDNVEALVARGALYANNESYTRAIEDFEKALEINSGHINARKYMCETLIVLSRSLMEEEKESDAVPYLERALSVDPDNTEAQSLLFQIQSKPPPIVWKGGKKADSSPEQVDLVTTPERPEDNPYKQTADTLRQIMKQESQEKHRPKSQKKKHMDQSSSSSSSDSSSEESEPSSSVKGKSKYQPDREKEKVELSPDSQRYIADMQKSKRSDDQDNKDRRTDERSGRKSNSLNQERKGSQPVAYSDPRVVNQSYKSREDQQRRDSSEECEDHKLPLAYADDRTLKKDISRSPPASSGHRRKSRSSFERHRRLSRDDYREYRDNREAENRSSRHNIENSRRSLDSKSKDRSYARHDDDHRRRSSRGADQDDKTIRRYSEQIDVAKDNRMLRRYSDEFAPTKKRNDVDNGADRRKDIGKKRDSLRSRSRSSSSSSSSGSSSSSSSSSSAHSKNKDRRSEKKKIDDKRRDSEIRKPSTKGEKEYVEERRRNEKIPSPRQQERRYSISPEERRERRRSRTPNREVRPRKSTRSDKMSSPRRYSVSPEERRERRRSRTPSREARPRKSTRSDSFGEEARRDDRYQRHRYQSPSPDRSRQKKNPRASPSMERGDKINPHYSDQSRGEEREVEQHISHRKSSREEDFSTKLKEVLETKSPLEQEENNRFSETLQNVFRKYSPSEERGTMEGNAKDHKFRETDSPSYIRDNRDVVRGDVEKETGPVMSRNMHIPDILMNVYENSEQMKAVGGGEGGKGMVVKSRWDSPADSPSVTRVELTEVQSKWDSPKLGIDIPPPEQQQRRSSPQVIRVEMRDPQKYLEIEKKLIEERKRDLERSKKLQLGLKVVEKNLRKRSPSPRLRTERSRSVERRSRKERKSTRSRSKSQENRSRSRKDRKSRSSYGRQVCRSRSREYKERRKYKSPLNEKYEKERYRDRSFDEHSRFRNEDRESRIDRKRRYHEHDEDRLDKSGNRKSSDNKDYKGKGESEDISPEKKRLRGQSDVISPKEAKPSSKSNTRTKLSEKDVKKSSKSDSTKKKKKKEQRKSSSSSSSDSSSSSSSNTDDSSSSSSSSSSSENEDSEPKSAKKKKVKKYKKEGKKSDKMKQQKEIESGDVKERRRKSSSGMDNMVSPRDKHRRFSSSQGAEKGGNFVAKSGRRVSSGDVGVKSGRKNYLDRKDSKDSDRRRTRDSKDGRDGTKAGGHKEADTDDIEVTKSETLEEYENFLKNLKQKKKEDLK